MSGLGLPIFDQAIQNANSWINDVMYELDGEDEHRAFMLLRSTLHIVRDRLQVDENAHFASQLPTLIRGVFYEGYQPSKYSADIRQKDQFVGAVMAAFNDNPKDDPVATLSAALHVIADDISAGKMDDIKSSLPEDIRQL